MRKMKIYLETTLFNRYFEPERDNYGDVRKLFAEIATGAFQSYSSAYVLEELSNTPDDVKRENMLELFAHSDINILDKSSEIEVLAEAYVAHGVITRPHYLDRLHLACASVNELDAIISLNFTHINRPKTKELTEPVNKLFGYRKIYIGSPMEVITNE
ncbi:MAG: hypothetical protein FWE98_05220 [Oscillospiraceae bacterium]|nr:hypothetical protein [Oscillospiraceae bacterium]